MGKIIKLSMPLGIECFFIVIEIVMQKNHNVEN